MESVTSFIFIIWMVFTAQHIEQATNDLSRLRASIEKGQCQ